jgi:hypothetical protein
MKGDIDMDKKLEKLIDKSIPSNKLLFKDAIKGFETSINTSAANKSCTIKDGTEEHDIAVDIIKRDIGSPDKTKICLGVEGNGCEIAGRTFVSQESIVYSGKTVLKRMELAYADILKALSKKRGYKMSPYLKSNMKYDYYRKIFFDMIYTKKGDIIVGDIELAYSSSELNCKYNIVSSGDGNPLITVNVVHAIRGKDDVVIKNFIQLENDGTLDDEVRREIGEYSSSEAGGKTVKPLSEIKSDIAKIIEDHYSKMASDLNAIKEKNGMK